MTILDDITPTNWVVPVATIGITILAIGGIYWYAQHEQKASDKQDQQIATQKQITINTNKEDKANEQIQNVVNAWRSSVTTSVLRASTSSSMPQATTASSRIGKSQSASCSGLYKIIDADTKQIRDLQGLVKADYDIIKIYQQEIGMEK